MELKDWLQDWQFERNPFLIFDADRDPFLKEAMVENTSLRSILVQWEKPTPFVVFGIRGSGKSSMRIDAEQYLRQFRNQVMVIKYVEFNELLSEKLKTKKIPAKFLPRKGIIAGLFKKEKEQILKSERKIILDDHIDYILRLAIEELHAYVFESNKEALLSHQEYAEKFVLLMTLYFAPNDFSKKLSSIKRVIKVSGLKKNAGLFDMARSRQLALEIYRSVNGVPISLDNTYELIKTIGSWLFTHHAIPTNTENRFTLVKYFMELVRYFGLYGAYLIVDRVDEPTSIKGDPEKMRELVTPLLDDQLFQVDHLGMLLFLPYELHDLIKYYRSDRIKTISSITWSPDNMLRLVEKRMNISRALGSLPLKLADLFEEEGQNKAQFIVRQLTPRNAFRLLSIILEEHCGSTVYSRTISTEVYEAAIQRYLLEKEGY